MITREQHAAMGKAVERVEAARQALKLMADLRRSEAALFYLTTDPFGVGRTMMVLAGVAQPTMPAIPVGVIKEYFEDELKAAEAAAREMGIEP
jgi:hypothetical protein